jgi:hypothetical protein
MILLGYFHYAREQVSMIIRNYTDAELIDAYQKIAFALSTFDEMLADDEQLSDYEFSQVTVVIDSDSSRAGPRSAGSGYSSNEGSGSGKCLFTRGVIWKRAPT